MPLPGGLARPAFQRAGLLAFSVALVLPLLVIAAIASVQAAPGHGSTAAPLSGQSVKAKPTSKPTPTPTHAPSPTPTPTATPPPQPACATSGPGSYTVTVCLAAPLPGARLVGTSTVTLSVTEGAGSPGVQRGVFTINGSPLLMDFTAPYTFSLDSRRWGDGTYAISAYVVMRDAYVSTAATSTVSFANGLRNGQPNNNHFTPTSGTSPAPGAPLVLAAVGDGADGGVGATSTVGLISSWNPNLFMYLGDVYEDGTPMEFNNWYGAGGTAGLYGQFRSITNPVVGNHEYVGNQAAGYFYYWDNIPHYYSYNSHGWHFIALDSTSQFNQTAPGTAQYNWLAADLAANTSPCTVIYYHHPILNVGPEGSTASMASMWRLFATYHVTLVLNGHDHDYQRFVPVDDNLNPSPTGVTEIIVGSGGHGTQNQITTDSRLVTSDFNDFGALKLNLYQTSATFQFQTTTGSVVDSGLIPCRNTNDSIAPSAPGGVTAAANGPGEIDVSWSASTDNVAVAGYDVFKDGSGTAIATLAPDARSYADSVVAPNTTHSYTVVAFDAKGNRSPPGGPASASTPDGTVTRILTPVADAYVNSDSPTINFGGSTVLRVASPSGTSTTTMHSYLRFDLSKIVGRIQSASLGVMANSTSNVGFSAAGVADNTWNEYAVTYGNGPPAGPLVGTSNGLAAGSRSSVDVTGLTAAGQGGLLSFELGKVGSQASLASRETATPPQLTIVVGSGATGPPTASFSASTTSTYTGVPVQFTDTSSGSPPTSWSWNFGDGGTSTLQNPSHAWTATGTYTVSLVTSNVYGSSAPATAQITVGTDSTPPSAPGAVAANAAGPGEIDVSWSASSDNVGVTGYEIYRDGSGTPLASVGAAALAYQDMLVAPNSTHSYTVKAVDAAGNRSDPGGPASATTPDGTVTYTLTPVADSYVDNANPAQPFGSNTALRVKNSGGAVMNSYLRFDLSSIVGQVRSASLSVLPSNTTSSQIQAGGVADTTWGEATIKFDNAPAIGSTVSASGGVTGGTTATLDVASLVAPAEGGLVSIGLTGNGGQISFGSRESATPPQLTIVVGSGSGSPPAASFSSSATSANTGVPIQFTDTSTGGPTSWSWNFGDGATSTQQNPSHAWTSPGPFTVTLVASNPYGASAPATTQVNIAGDTDPPTVPQNVTATAAGGTAIDVGWSASTDTFGVTGYDVYRDGSSTAIVTLGGSTLTYHDTGLGVGSTHTYTVDAFDAAGNHSALSSPPASATTASNQTYVLSPVADAYVDSGNAGSFFGGFNTIRVKNNSGVIMNSYLRFDLSAIAGTVQSATLTLVPTTTTSSQTQVAGVADTTWGELTICYNNAPAIGPVVSSSGSITSGIPVNFNVLSLVSPAEGGLVSFGLTGTNTQTPFGSREATSASNRPTLTIVVSSP